jgi:acyl-CoA thioesterase-1
LRGQSPADAKANLDQLIARLKARNIAVLLAGMRAPKNWGEAYAREFDGMYAELAAKHDLILYPFFLDGVALDPSLNLDDGLHPNGKGVAEIVKRILPKVEDLLRRVTVARSSLQSKS